VSRREPSTVGGNIRERGGGNTDKATEGSNANDAEKAADGKVMEEEEEEEREEYDSGT
jgi:hypothetical protein